MVIILYVKIIDVQGLRQVTAADVGAAAAVAGGRLGPREQLGQWGQQGQPGQLEQRDQQEQPGQQERPHHVFNDNHANPHKTKGFTKSKDN